MCRFFLAKGDDSFVDSRGDEDDDADDDHSHQYRCVHHSHKCCHCRLDDSKDKDEKYPFDYSMAESEPIKSQRSSSLYPRAGRLKPTVFVQQSFR